MVPNYKVESISKHVVCRLWFLLSYFLPKFEHNNISKCLIELKAILVKSKTANPYFHVIFWVVVVAILIVIFGGAWQGKIQAFFFISLFLPVIMSTSYFFNYYLVPKFLLKGKYLWFTLYCYYTLVISLFLEMLVLFISFVYLANYKIANFGINSSDIILLAVVMYLVVFFGSFLLMVQQLFDSNRELEVLKNEQRKMERPFIELISNRKSVRIPYDNIIYIESLADYVKVHSSESEEITSKEKISVLEEKLPEFFVRIHRSFIVNRQKIIRFNNNEVEMQTGILSIGRSYKKQALLKLKSEQKI